MSRKQKEHPRRRGRELALQALVSLEPPNPGLGAMLYRMRERALVAEAEAALADGRKEDARAAADALLVLDKGHAAGKLFVKILDGVEPPPPPPTTEERAELEAIRGGPDELDFADVLVRGVADHRDAIDKTIADSSTNWKVQRMAIVDRNILRIGVFELVHLLDVPPRVTLNEAIEIGKRYGTGDTGAFVNGILDKIAQTARPHAASTSAPASAAPGKAGDGPTEP